MPALEGLLRRGILSNLTTLEVIWFDETSDITARLRAVEAIADADDDSREDAVSAFAVLDGLSWDQRLNAPKAASEAADSSAATAALTLRRAASPVGRAATMADLDDCLQRINFWQRR